MLTDWFFDEVAPEVMIEELHTAFELTWPASSTAATSTTRHFSS